jgi:excisionase family DNA binding protein
MSAPTVITAPELASILGVDLKTVHNWVKRGLVDHYRTPGRQLRFRAGDAARLIRDMGGEVPPALVQHGLSPIPDVVRRVFVAGPSAELSRCVRAVAEVRDALGPGGVTFDWCPLVVQAREGRPVPSDADQAAACLRGLAESDLVWLLLPSPGVSTVGAWFEAGATCMLRKPVAASFASPPGERPPFPPPYRALVHFFYSDADAVGEIRKRASRSISPGPRGRRGGEEER